jgi:membrane protease YdiL (CAAX protease family)
MKRFVQGHPVAGFFLMAFAIAWLGSFLVAGPKFFRGEAIEPLDTGLVALAMLAAPILSGILMAFIVDGKRGIGDMFSRMRIWRVGKWYLTLLIFPFFILVVSLLLSTTVSPEFTPIFLAVGILMGITAGFIEETGWMGFAFPRMRLKHGLIRAGVYLGFLHGLWHFMVWFLVLSSDLGIYWYPYFVAFVTFVVALRIIMVWAYYHTNSLFLSQMIHASSTGFLAVFIPEYIEPVNWVIFYSVYAAVLLVVALVVIRNMAGPSR